MENKNNGWSADQEYCVFYPGKPWGVFVDKRKSEITGEWFILLMQVRKHKSGRIIPNKSALTGTTLHNVIKTRSYNKQMVFPAALAAEVVKLIAKRVEEIGGEVIQVKSEALEQLEQVVQPQDNQPDEIDEFGEF